MTDTQPQTASSLPTVQPQYFYANRMGRILLLAFEDVLGHNALNALLKLANYENYIHQPPPNNSDRQFSFATVGALTEAMQRMYGPRGARGVALRVGRVCFKYGIREYGPMMGIAELTFQLLPFSLKLDKGATAFADLFNHHTDQIVRLQDTPDRLYWHIERCPVCWGVRSEQPCCHLAVGLLQESLQWLSGGKNFLVEEETCIARGDSTCTISIAKKPLD